MTVAPFTAAPRARPAPLDPIAAEMRRHLQLMGYGTGAVELVAGTNRADDPDRIALLVWTKDTYGQGRHTREWVASDRPVALQRKAAGLAAEWGNVYISAGTYGQAPNPYKGGKLQYSRSAPLPGGSIVADDVTAEGLALLARRGLPPTWATETSPGNHQIGLVPDEDIPPAQRQRLAEGLALLLGSDPSGSDAQQLIRIAGSLNTKAKCAGRPGNPDTGQEPEGWRVRLVAEGPRYPVERLARALLPGGLAELRRGAGSDADNPQLSAPKTDRTNPAEIAALEALGGAAMATGRYQRFFARRPQLAALAMGQRVTLQTKHGPRDTGSEQVAVLVSNLATTGRKNEAGKLVPGLGAPPVEEIRAVALYWRKRLRPDKLPGAYLADVDGMLKPAPDGYLPAGYAPEATRGLNTAAEGPALPELPPAQHKGPGRPAGQRADNAGRLVELLAARVGELVKRGELAAALGVKIRMVAYLLADLQAEGRAELRRAGRGLQVVRCAINTPLPDVQSLAPVEAAEGAATLQSADVQPLGSTHPAPLPPCPAPAAGDAPALDTAELLALIDAGRIAIRRGLDPCTGEQGDTGRSRASRELVWCYVAQHAPDVARATFDAAWAEGQDIFRTFDRWLAGEPESGELYAELRKLQAGIDRAREPAPMPWAELPDDRRRKLVDRARALAPQAVEALVLRARGEAPPAPLGDAEALAVAQERYARRIAAHKRDCQQLKRREILRDKLRRALRYRGLPLEAPPATIGKRAKAPGRDDVRRAEAEQQAEGWAAYDRLIARARAEAPPATRRPRVELPRAVNSTRESTDASPPALDLAAARARMVERIRRGESLILPAQEASFAD
jgi:hypothetical protein